ncbi:hypothetical protein PBRA_002411 [Plasmodiophora brassicae]|nr:hypothetical protein PBRA_002411 [Plasmodiophora brassicae]
MYFSSELFVKRGPLGNLWLAGTVFHKLSKKAILNSNIVSMCKSIQNPPVPLALPARALLFMGVCRIMDKKAHYLLVDAVDARSKVQLARTTSHVNLSCSRGQARVDSINIAGDVDDVPLPPIPFDIFDKANADCDFGEVALFVETPDVNDVSLCNHGKFIANEAEITLDDAPNPMDFVVPLDQALLDPLIGDDDFIAMPDGTERSSFGGSDTVGGDFMLPPIDIGICADLNEEMASNASARTRYTGSSTAGTVLSSKKRKRTQVKHDKETVIPVQELDREVNGSTAALLCKRTSIQVKRATQHPETIFVSTLSRQLCPVLAAQTQVDFNITSYDKRRGREFIEDADLDRYESNSMGNNYDANWQGGATTASFDGGDRRSTGTRDEPIEQMRSAMLDPLAEDDEEPATFLGKPIQPPTDSHTVHSGASRRKTDDRMSILSVGSLGSGASHRLSSVRGSTSRPVRPAGGDDDFPTPDFDLSLSQFYIPEVEERGGIAQGSQFNRREGVDRETEILHAILEENFVASSGGEIDRVQPVDFSDAIQRAVGSDIQVSRKDASMSFVQMLVLKAMDMINIAQLAPYGPITITPTSKFALSFSSSQL